MGLFISGTDEKKIHITGLSFKPASVYARLRFVGHPDGVKMEIQADFYEDKNAFKAGTPIPCIFETQQNTQGPVQVIAVDLKEGMSQSVESAHACVKEAFEALGYSVVSEIEAV